MPKREDEFWAAQKEGRGRGLCPFCGSSNISYNPKFESWRCNNCEHSFPMPSYGPGDESGKEARWFGKTTEGERRKEFAKAARRNRESKSRDKQPASRLNPDPTKLSNSGKEIVNRPVHCLWALLLIFAFSIIGLGISIFIGSFITFWLLLGFSSIYSVEKWFSYSTRKYKWAGKLYRLILNLSILSLLGLFIWSGSRLFSSQFTYSALVGSLVFLSEFVFFIWMWRVVSKNSWRWPSMKLTVFSLIAVSIVFAFAGVQPMASYKDNVVTKWGAYWAEQKTNIEERLAQIKIEEQNRIEEQKATEQQKLAEQKTKEAQIQAELHQSYAQLFNDFRIQNDKPPLTFDARLNELANQRAIEISQPGNFNHEGIKKYNLGENIAMMAYSTDSNTKLLEQWANSPGHRSNMLSLTYSRTGFARIGRYAVQIFD